MSLDRNDVPWLKRGSQRAAVARALRKPMTGMEICTVARTINPRIQLRDVWHLLHQMQEREMVHCINPRLVTGRLYALTERGRDEVHAAVGVVIAVPPANIDWRKYSWVVRAKIRRLVLAASASVRTTNARRTSFGACQTKGSSTSVFDAKAGTSTFLLNRNRACSGMRLMTTVHTASVLPTLTWIHADALPRFAGKRVRIFGHDDEAGRGAVERWAAQLATVGADLDAFSFAGHQQVGGKPVKDLNDSLSMDAASFARVETMLPL